MPWGIKMMRTTLLLIALFTVGCAVNPVVDHDLYKTYSELSASVASDNIVKERGRYFTDLYLSEVNDEDEKSLFLLKIPRYIINVDSHYQKSNSERGCLTVNGFENSGDPVSIYVEYRHESDEWRVNYMYVNFLESSGGFVKAPLCPDEVEGH